MRTRAERRKNTWNKIRRRMQIERDTNPENHELIFDNSHQYSKDRQYTNVNSVNKTNNKGKHRFRPKNYAPSKNWKYSDKQRIESCESQSMETQTQEEIG